MASHIKAVKKAKMTHGMCATLCKYKKQNPTCTHKQLRQWISQKVNLQVS